MTDLKQRFIDGIIEIEGGYSNNPDDSGGETKYGITAQVARNYGYKGPMRDLPRDLAFRIYSDLYWHSLKLDHVVGLSPLIAEELADTGVNMGVGRAAKFLQRSLNAFNKQQQLYPDLVVDGAIGNATIDALQRYLHLRQREGETVLYRALNALQGAKYIALAEAREKDETFIYGWLLNRVGMAGSDHVL
ncbi:hypothetical protein O4H49_13050 [Kiloniella laminariae]|uniref:Secretion activator protein n=1 Tax=Kiloniella laminariae TaxID=454162 RepID=A0ABT4LKS8_9PROT|nr:glycosyl hydrolase 108 family protein [Kiloniella laminariae]MCZ4281711.1 hypothetical protein [Kiloniella laminariae]